jgi:hypothetical protein
MLQVCCCVFALISAGSAFAATVAVGTCQPGKVSFDSLDDAVNGVPDGSTILVCPGIYQEQIVINRSLTMKAVSNGNTSLVAIVPPPGGLVGNQTSFFEHLSFFGGGTPLAPQVTINNGATVTLNGITIDAHGPITTNCFPMIVGVYIQDASATLTNMVVKNQIQTGPGPGPCFFLGGDGVGVFAQNDGNAGLTTVNINNSSFSNSGQNYESDGANNTSTLTNNTFLGTPLTDGNSINIFDGPATVKNNTMSNFTFPGNQAASDFNLAPWAIYMECQQGSTIANNTITNSQGGIVIGFPTCPTSGVYITGNTITDGSEIAIYLGEINASVSGNIINNSQTAIRLPAASDGNTIFSNRINGVCAAFASSPGALNNSIGTNTITNALNIAISNNTNLCP